MPNTVRSAKRLGSGDARTGVHVPRDRNLVDVAQELATDVLATCLFVVEDTRGCGLDQMVSLIPPTLTAPSDVPG